MAASFASGVTWGPRKRLFRPSGSWLGPSLRRGHLHRIGRRRHASVQSASGEDRDGCCLQEASSRPSPDRDRPSRPIPRAPVHRGPSRASGEDAGARTCRHHRRRCCSTFPSVLAPDFFTAPSLLLPRTVSAILASTSVCLLVPFVPTPLRFLSSFPTAFTIAALTSSPLVLRCLPRPCLHSQLSSDRQSTHEELARYRLPPRQTAASPQQSSVHSRAASDVQSRPPPERSSVCLA